MKTINKIIEMVKNKKMSIVLGLASATLGASCAGIGRAIGGDGEIVASLILPGMDAISGGNNLRGLVPYALGVGLAYSDKIYPLVQEFLRYWN